LTRRILQLEIEREALKKETDEASKERLAKLEAELASEKEKSNALRAQWEQEKAAIQEVRAIREQIEQTNIQIEQAERDADLAKAAELRYGRLRELEAQLKQAQARLAELQKGNPLLKEEVGPDEVAAVVSRWTGIPVSRLMEGEMQEAGAYGGAAAPARGGSG
jgi:ATP-dependent Clp protease ATP-binding subunit ClpB